MNILFIASVYHHLTSFHIPYMTYLQQQGYTVWAACAKEDIAKKELTDMGFLCVDIPFSRSPCSTKHIGAYRKLSTLFVTETFEMVHVHTPVAAFLTRLAFRHSKRGKILYTAHGFHFYEGAPLVNWLLYYSVERLATRWTDGLITINEEDYKRALTMSYRKGAVHYVHGVGIEPIQNQLEEVEKRVMKKRLGLSADAVVISYIAEINKNKNHLYLLRNWKKIKEQVPKATLLIIGEGSLCPVIQRFISKRGLEDVHLLGYRDDVSRLLTITDVVSLLSHREGLPKSIMEAMAASLPCIVSDTRGLRDLVTNGENGYVVPQGDDFALVESFINVLNDKETRLAMGIVGLETVRKYQMENVLQQYRVIYEDLLIIK